MQSIKLWSEDDRPREKLVRKGARNLSQAELLAILIGSGTRSLSAVGLAREILKEANDDLQQLGVFSTSELQRISGVGPAKAVTIQAAMELSRRILIQQPKKPIVISSSRDAYSVLSSEYLGLIHEEFHVLYLNRGNRVIALEQISKGGMSGTVADGKVIFRKALSNSASALILSHNHPSGQLNPSEADQKLTQSLVSFGKLIDIQILDHLIITNDNYFSFADEGLMTV